VKDEEHRHQTICPEANAMVRSSAFGASFCEETEVSKVQGKHHKILQALESGSRFWALGTRLWRAGFKISRSSEPLFQAEDLLRYLGVKLIE